MYREDYECLYSAAEVLAKENDRCFRNSKACSWRLGVWEFDEAGGGAEKLVVCGNNPATTIRPGVSVRLSIMTLRLALATAWPLSASGLWSSLNTFQDSALLVSSGFYSVSAGLHYQNKGIRLSDNNPSWPWPMSCRLYYDPTSFCFRYV